MKNNNTDSPDRDDSIIPSYSSNGDEANAVFYNEGLWGALRPEYIPKPPALQPQKRKPVSVLNIEAPSYAPKSYVSDGTADTVEITTAKQLANKY
ncbi:MAG: hypothetical protein OEY79_01940 [Anaplasmataceae bacterium]|nr:hypothetical protein [Anaplasmataceae bacterium]